MKPRPIHLEAWELFVSSHAKALQAIENEMDRGNGLPLHQYDVLLVLNRAPERRARLNEIADRVITSRSSVTRTVDKLAQAGLVRKVRAEEDGRGQYAELTEKGRSALREAWPIYREQIHRHFSRYLSEQEASALAKLLRKYEENRKNLR